MWDRKALLRSAEQASQYFQQVFGKTNDEIFQAMRGMTLDELETLQGFADDLSAGGMSDAAQQIGLDWSTKISTFIA